MRESLQKICEKFIQNRDIIKETFKWDSQYIIPVCASQLCGENILADADKMKHCKEIVEDKTGVFSSFRGNVKLPMITMLAKDENPKQKMNNTMLIYDILKKYFHGSEYLAMVAGILEEMVSVEQVENYAVRGRKIYDLMKDEHPFLTGREDSVFAVLMSFSDKKDSELIADMESCYSFMKHEFLSGEAMQSLSHVLALAPGKPEEKCKRVMDIFYGLKNADHKYGKSYELSALGALSMISENVDTIIEDIICVDNFLEQQKGYGIWGCNKKMRLMHAAMLVANDYSQNTNIHAAAVTSTLMMIAAQQAAMCAIIAASVAANSSAN